jgi:hypothetical protein
MISIVRPFEPRKFALVLLKSLTVIRVLQILLELWFHSSISWCVGISALKIKVGMQYTFAIKYCSKCEFSYFIKDILSLLRPAVKNMTTHQAGVIHKKIVIEFRRTIYWTGYLTKFSTLTTYTDSNSALRLTPFYCQDQSHIADSMAIIRILSALRRMVPNLLFPMALLFSSLSKSSTASWITKFIYWSKSSNFPRTDLPPLNLMKTGLLI